MTEAPAPKKVRSLLAPLAGLAAGVLLLIFAGGLFLYAELFGPGLPVDEAAAAWGTISYELLTGLSRRVPRVYEGGASA